MKINKIFLITLLHLQLTKKHMLSLPVANITASRANLFAVVGGTSCASATKWRRYY